MLRLAERGEVAWRRTCYDPGHFTASAFVLCPERAHLLMIRHKKLGRWLQPGGHVEPGDESLFRAACREAQEETGVALRSHEHAPVPFDVDIHEIPARPSEPAHQHFDVRYLLHAASRDLVRSDEVGGVRWVALAEVVELNREESIARPVRKLLTRMPR